jgi:thiamine-phosphate pyrophosphorylase
MLVTDRHRTRGRDLARLVQSAVRGGVGLVQVREPDLADDELAALVQCIAALLPAGVPLIVNGRAAVAHRLGLGLHLPARAPAPPPELVAGQLFGRSAHGAEEAREAFAERVSYIVAGTLWDTGAKRGLGLGVLGEIRELAAREVERGRAAVPLFGIGGVTVTRVPEVIHAGAHGIAVSGAILEDNDPRRVAQALTLALRVCTGG